MANVNLQLFVATKISSKQNKMCCDYISLHSYDVTDSKKKNNKVFKT